MKISVKGQMRRTMKGSIAATKARTEREARTEERINKFFWASKTEEKFPKLVNREMYSTMFIAKCYNISIDLNKVDADFTCEVEYQTVSNSPFNREMFEKFGEERVGEALKFTNEDPNGNVREWSTILGERYHLLKNVIKVKFDFVNDKKLSEGEKASLAKEIFSSQFIIDGKNMTLTDGFTSGNIYEVGAWSPSSEKAYVLSAYHMSSNSEENTELIAKMHDNLSDGVFSLNLSAPQKKKDAKKNAERVPATSSPQCIEIGALADPKDTSTGRVLLLNDKISTELEIIMNDRIKEALNKFNVDLAVDSFDGGAIFSAAWLANQVNQSRGTHFSAREMLEYNLQARIGGVQGKVFAITMTRLVIDKIVKELINGKVEGADYIFLGNPNAPIYAILDKNAAKIFNISVLVDNKPAQLTVNLMAVAETTDGLHLSSQMYNKVCTNEEDRKEFDEYIVDKFNKEFDELVEREVKPYITSKMQLQDLVVSLNPEYACTTLVRKSILKEAVSKANSIASKGSVKVDGIYEHLTFDISNVISGRKLTGLLGVSPEGAAEIYSPYRDKFYPEIERAVMMKYPSQGLDEAPRVKFVSCSELIRRAELRLAGDDLEAVKQYVKFLGKGTVMLPAINIMKQWVAGMDADYDAVAVVTDPKFVEIVWRKFDGFKATALDSEERVAMGIGCHIVYNEKYSNAKSTGRFSQSHLASTTRTYKTLKELFVASRNEIVLGSVIGKVISRGDCAITLDTNFMFNEDGTITEDGKKMFKKVFKIAGSKADVEAKKEAAIKEGVEYVGYRYNTVHVDNVLALPIGKLGLGHEAVLLDYITGSSVILAFRDELEKLDLDFMTREDYQNLLFDFSFMVRALGESAIDIVKKGKEVDLGVAMNTIVASNLKLSAAFKNKGSFTTNLDKFIGFAVYNDKEDRFNNKFIMNYSKNIEAAVKFMEAKAEYDDSIVIDKFGVLKHKLLKELVEVVNEIGADFNSSLSDVYDWSSKVINVGFGVAKNYALKKGISIQIAYEVLKECLFKASKLIAASKDAVYGNADKDVIKTIRLALIGCFSKFGSVIGIKEIVRLCALASIRYYSAENAWSDNMTKVFGLDSMKASDSYTEENKARVLDSSAYLIFKIFGEFSAFLFTNDSLRVRLDAVVTDNKYASMQEATDVANLEFAKVGENKYEIFFKGDRHEVIATFSMPEELAYLTPAVDNIDIVEEDNKFVLCTRIGNYAMSSDYKVVVLDKVVDTKGRTTKVDPMFYSKGQAKNKAYEITNPFADKVNWTMYDFIGKKVVTSNYGLTPSELSKVGNNEPFSGKYSVYVSGNEKRASIGNALLKENVEGVCELAFNNVLIVK